MTYYSPYPLQSHSDYREHYAVRVGGCGGKLLGRDFKLDRYSAVLLCEMLEEARQAGRDERMAA